MVHCVHRYPGAPSFLRRAEAWLLQAEAEHNLVLGLARQLAASTEAFEPPIYLATLEEEGEVVGCAFRTPPYKLGLTRMPAAALPVLVEDVAGVYTSIPAVLGPEPQVQQFAELWSAKQGIPNRPGMRQGIYQLEAVVLPELRPPGRLRPAGPDDLFRVISWIHAFQTDAGVRRQDPERLAEDRMAEQALFFWEDEEPVSMAGWTGQTPHGVRVGYVYTPPAHRRRGYASACVAALSQQLLESGHRFCFLYTDLANPTSNRIYQRIGYRLVCKVMDYHFDEPTN